MEDYIVIESISIERFLKLVNNAINKGYTPCGGISVSVSGSGFNHYRQALVLNKQNEEKH